jgi:PIN domain nuclease of toxin-antitoxin system
MADYVPDTHSLIWRATTSSRLGAQAAAVFDQVDQGNARLLIPAIVVAELLFTIERRKLPVDFNQLIQRWQANAAIEFVPLSIDVVLLMHTVTVIPEMHDRLIACEARLRNAIVLTRDPLIVSSGVVPTVW